MYIFSIVAHNAILKKQLKTSQIYLDGIFVLKKRNQINPKSSFHSKQSHNKYGCAHLDTLFGFLFFKIENDNNFYIKNKKLY